MPKVPRKRPAPERAQCPDCGKWLSRRQDLPRHRSTHDKGAKRYCCFFPNCSFSAIQRQGFTSHIVKHTGERPYRCAFCDFNAQDPSLVTKHHSKRHNYTRGAPEEQVRQITRPVVDWDALRCNTWNGFKIPLLEAWFDSADDRPRRKSGAPSTSDSASPEYISSDEDSPSDEEEDEIDDCESTTESMDCVDELTVEPPASISTTELAQLKVGSSFVEAFIPEILDDAETIPGTPTPTASVSTKAMPLTSANSLAQMTANNPTLHPALAYVALSGSSHPPHLASDLNSVIHCVPNAPTTSAYNSAWESRSTHDPSPSFFEAAQDASMFSWLYDDQVPLGITPDVKSQYNELLEPNHEVKVELSNAFDFTSDSVLAPENCLDVPHAKSWMRNDGHYTNNSTPPIDMFFSLPDDNGDPTPFVTNDSDKLLYNFFREFCGGGANV